MQESGRAAKVWTWLVVDTSSSKKSMQPSETVSIKKLNAIFCLKFMVLSNVSNCVRRFTEAWTLVEEPIIFVVCVRVVSGSKPSLYIDLWYRCSVSFRSTMPYIASLQAKVLFCIVSTFTHTFGYIKHLFDGIYIYMNESDSINILAMALSLSLSLARTLLIVMCVVCVEQTFIIRTHRHVHVHAIIRCQRFCNQLKR